jgi:hypothetical protein
MNMLKAVPMPGRTFMAGSILALFVLEGFWSGLASAKGDDWSVQAAWVAGSMFAAATKGAIIGGILWLCAKGAEGFRLRNPRFWVQSVGLAIYLLGSAIGVYSLILAFYMLSVAIYAPTPGASNVVFFLASCGLFYWFFGRAISYMLGR